MKEYITKPTMSSSPDGIVYIKFDELTDLTSIKSGGYGLIHKASHARFGTVAYKEIKVESAESHEASLLQDEAKIHFGLNHANVVKMHGLIFEGSNSGLVLEFMDNGDLIEFIRKHKPGYETRLKLLSEVASGMRFLHEHTPPIIHGDLKATNVLISQDVHAKVNDFGFSRTKEYSQSTSVHNVRLGTVTHIPPENWENPYLRKTEKFDVYGFGIMIWEVMTEEKPYSEAQGNDAVISVWVRQGMRPNISTFPAVPEILQSLQLFMQRCWQQHPPMRPNFSKIERKLEELASTEKDIIPKILKKEQPANAVIPTERMTTGIILEPKITITSNVIKGTRCAPSLSTDKIQTATVSGVTNEKVETSFERGVSWAKFADPGVTRLKNSTSGSSYETIILRRRGSEPKENVSASASGFTPKNIPKPEETVEKASKKPLRRSISQTESSASWQDQLDGQCWYFGDQTFYTKELCEDMLRAFIEKDGTYLVRKNRDGGPKQPYTLSIVYHLEVIHARIHLRPDNKYSLGANAAHHFESVPRLISYYQNNLLNLGEDI